MIDVPDELRYRTISLPAGTWGEEGEGAGLGQAAGVDTECSVIG